MAKGVLIHSWTWRERAAPIIAEVLRETADRDERAIRKALRDAYPFGPRRHFPYRAWCDEVRRQRGLKAPTKREREARRAAEVARQQVLLFEE